MSKLKKLQRRKGKLKKELLFLNERHAFLFARMKTLEETLRAHGLPTLERKLEMDEHSARQAVSAEAKLKRLEKLVEENDWRKEHVQVNVSQPPSQLRQLAGKTEIMRVDNSKLKNYIRLNEHVVFSWSYKELS